MVALAAEKSLYGSARLARVSLGLVGNPYRTPTLVGKGKTPTVDERSSVKELGKLAP